ncbi:MAG: hypothetical protein C0631_03610 [Sedimenticola sp.]|jgi:hypothetical protein|nr:MAG: hypothetical protein C0631_03610 [Sedimenticola sp.]
MIPAVIDIEASGFGRNSYPIEIGVITPERMSYCYLIRPDKTWKHWDSSAETIHGISRHTLLEKGESPREIARQLNQLFLGQTLYSDAWSHDISWLGKLYDICDSPLLYRIESIRTLISEEQTAFWHPTKEQVIAQLQLTRHRASTDALILQETYRQVVALTKV